MCACVMAAKLGGRRIAATGSRTGRRRRPTAAGTMVMSRDASQADGDQAQLFVSYARKDSGTVGEITRLLEGAGVSVWRDRERILGGQYFGEEIVHAIAHSRVLMVMCSPHSFESDNVFREVALTWDYHRHYLPVWLTDPVEIPARLRYHLVSPQWVEAHAGPPEEWLPRLLKALSAMGVDVRGGSPSPKPVEAKPAAADPRSGERRPGLRFKPGDRPIAGSDWVLERLLGKGGFGEVWRAHYPHLLSQPPVALKFCLGLDERSRDLLRHEADLVLRAQRHIRSDGIVPLLHAYLNNDPPCLEYPYIEGGTLVGLLDECRQSAAGAFTPAQAERIILQIAKIVGPAHRANPRLVHRDLKPSNVLVERLTDGKIKLRVTDFGIGGLSAQPMLERSRSSSSMEGELSAVLTGAYSPLYASPQQMKHEKPDPRDDVYALGVIWHQLLTGDLACPAPTGRRWGEALLERGMSEGALDLLSSCVESSPVHRPDDAAVLAERLEAAPVARGKKGGGSRGKVVPVEKSESASLERPAVEAEVNPFAERRATMRPGDNRPAAGAESEEQSFAERRATMRPGVERPAAAPGPELQPVRSPRSIVPVTAPGMGARREPSGNGGGRLRGWVAAGAVGLCALFGIIIYIVTNNGTVKIVGADDRMKLTIDGADIRIENLGKPITIRAGEHELLVERDGLKVETQKFEIDRGQEKVLEVTYTRPGEKRELPKAEPPKTASTEAGAVSEAAPAAPANASPRGGPEYITTVAGRIKLKLIPAGEFFMGSDQSDPEAEDDESVVTEGKKQKHRVRITRPFFLGATEVTRGQFRTFVDDAGYKTEAEKDGKGGYGWDEEKKAFREDPKFTWRNAGFEQTDEHPVVNVSWNDAVAFCEWLKSKEGEPYRLPSEAEWEYACRAGTTTRYSSGDDPETLVTVGDVADATLKAKFADWTTIAASDGYVFTAPVGKFRANSFGLYDTHGNVWEWCQDSYDSGYYKTSPVDDPACSAGASRRVIRGGSWFSSPRFCRSAYRGGGEPEYRYVDLGFRVARGQSNR